ncbi:MAG: hypothetical protein GX237_10240 [Clostridiales bacterium]|nr:hypothetical protein [Clostridiales bacterium]
MLDLGAMPLLGLLGLVVPLLVGDPLGGVPLSMGIILLLGVWFSGLVFLLLGRSLTGDEESWLLLAFKVSSQLGFEFFEELYINVLLNFYN